MADQQPATATNEDQLRLATGIGREHNCLTQLKRAIERHDIPAYRLGRRWLYVKQSDFFEWLESRRIHSTLATRTEEGPGDARMIADASGDDGAGKSGES